MFEDLGFSSLNKLHGEGECESERILHIGTCIFLFVQKIVADIQVTHRSKTSKKKLTTVFVTVT